MDHMTARHDGVSFAIETIEIAGPSRRVWPLKPDAWLELDQIERDDIIGALDNTAGLEDVYRNHVVCLAWRETCRKDAAHAAVAMSRAMMGAELGTTFEAEPGALRCPVLDSDPELAALRDEIAADERALELKKERYGAKVCTRFEPVLTREGLEDFEREWARALDCFLALCQEAAGLTASHVMTVENAPHGILMGPATAAPVMVMRSPSGDLHPVKHVGQGAYACPNVDENGTWVIEPAPRGVDGTTPIGMIPHGWTYIAAVGSYDLFACYTRAAFGAERDVLAKLNMSGHHPAGAECWNLKALADQARVGAAWAQEASLMLKRWREEHSCRKCSSPLPVHGHNGVRHGGTFARHDGGGEVCGECFEQEYKSVDRVPLLATPIDAVGWRAKG